MADPHHVEKLDDFDRLTVGAYRTGIAVAGLALAGMAVQHARHASDLPARALLLLGLALIGAHLHLYDRRIRWAIVASGWLGAVLLYAGAVVGNGWVSDAGLGFVFVTLSGVAKKERLCFKLPLVNGVPIALAASLVPLRLGLEPLSALCLAVGAGLVLLLAGAKARMPLHFDIGDRSKYQVWSATRWYHRRMRWLWPILMFAITGWVWWYNGTHTDRQVMFPFVDMLFPELGDDPVAMGRRSVEILFGVSGAVTLFTFVEQLRAIARYRRRRQEEQREE